MDNKNLYTFSLSYTHIEKQKAAGCTTHLSISDMSNDIIPAILTEGASASDLKRCGDVKDALAEIELRYNRAIAQLRKEFDDYLNGTLNPDRGQATYPYLAVDISPDWFTPKKNNLAFGKFRAPGIYGTTLTAPLIFRDYIEEQLSLIMDGNSVPIFVGNSTSRIPITFALEKATAQVSLEHRQNLPHYFYVPDLAGTNDGIVDGKPFPKDVSIKPLSLFPADRIDYSLHRLSHYTATHPEHFQRFILFTNYQRYVDEFVEYGKAELDAGRYTSFVEPGNRISVKGSPDPNPPIAKLPQMPAYHLTRDDRLGISLVNIGVGPSNAKTVTDHLAVLRPHAWLMIGHCGGLRRSQRLGDYVLAHAYLRDDHILDEHLPPEIPLPTIAEVQVALTAAVGEVTGLKGRESKNRLRTGTVVTTDDRNWELRFDQLATRFNQSRAIAIDMESATIAANGYRYRVPYGTLLCVSDRPLHGEIKLPGMADLFYEESVSQHLKISIRSIELLRKEADAGTLHSRKLRSFDEPAFR